MSNRLSGQAWLFVPANRADRFEKAKGAGADVVLLDLEDAVGAAEKDTAREAARSWLSRGGSAVVRINGSDTPWHRADVAMATEQGAPVMLPKAEHAAQVATLIGQLPPKTPVVVLIETAAGVLAAQELCASSGVVRAAFGSIDLAAELEVDASDFAALDHARQKLVLASASAGLEGPLDGVTTALDDPAALDADLRAGARLGFTGKLCIHPRQVGAVRAAFAPSEAQLDWARRVLATDDDGAVAIDGRMIDKPVRRRASTIVARAHAEVAD